ncbi:MULTISPECIES: hypothetical protein [Clostridium]|uniref:hypothetical protein n=1 Tax=Clostridium TaxID=1485 RepID=UPI0002CBD78F|nr:MULTISPECIES: hypothetical protein [Clostridium]EMU55306.1 hypothetical protein CBDKU1_07320 [Clostridium butyricum DKU-01]MBS4843138.1 hypothetical protein [Clostridium sp.]MDU1404196.1 hypothetical protein [Clostridium sp.]MDU1605467.1 hypothetical protein [Clostridium sp.]MDU2895963.1 hypothetical protein [Clostridium sp.]
MYNELDELLLEETTVDSWYDDGFSIAQDILNQFSNDDWQELSNEVLKKDLDWQRKLVYCLDNQVIEEELNIICKLIVIDDEELFEMCIDALRGFDNELGHSFIRKNPKIIIDVKKRVNVVGNATKRVLEDFLRKFAI